MIRNNSDKVPAILKKQIAQEVASGKSLTDISKQYGVTRQTISKWKNHDDKFLKQVEQCENEIIQDRRNAANMLLIGTLEKQILDLKRMADDPDVPIRDRIGIKKYLINKQIEDAKSVSIRNQSNNTQINIDNSKVDNKKKSIEEILNSFDTDAVISSDVIDIDTDTDIDIDTDTEK